MSNTSAPLPSFVSWFVNETVAPCSTLPTVWPENRSATDWSTANGATFVKNGPTSTTPSWYAKRAELLMTCGARAAFTMTSNVTLPDCPEGTELTIAVTAPGVETVKSQRMVGPAPCVSVGVAEESGVGHGALRGLVPGR